MCINLTKVLSCLPHHGFPCVCFFLFLFYYHCQLYWFHFTPETCLALRCVRLGVFFVFFPCTFSKHILFFFGTHLQFTVCVHCLNLLVFTSFNKVKLYRGETGDETLVKKWALIFQIKFFKRLCNLMSPIRTVLEALEIYQTGEIFSFFEFNTCKTSLSRLLQRSLKP